jgi:hypothetical protein
LSYLKEHKEIAKFTALPPNNVTCYLQNRAQYWRLSSSKSEDTAEEKCECCEFTMPFLQSFAKAPAFRDNQLTGGILTFLKENEHLIETSPQKLPNIIPPIEYPIQNSRNAGTYYDYTQPQVNPQLLALFNVMNNATTTNAFHLNSISAYNNNMNNY